MKKKFHIYFTLPTVMLITGGFFFLLLPLLCNNYLFPRIADRLPFTEKKISISRISPWNLQGMVLLAGSDQSAISIPRFELYFSPRSLFRGRIDRLLIDAATVHIEIINGRPFLRGLQSSPNLTGGGADLPLHIPAAIETLSIENSTLIVHSMGREVLSLRIDSRLNLSFNELERWNKRLIAVSGTIETGGGLSISGTLAARATAEGHAIDWLLKIPRIEQLIQFIKRQDLAGSGELVLNGQVNLDNSSTLSNYRIIAELPNFHGNFGTITLAGRPDRPPLSVDIRGNKEKVRYTLANLAMAGPEKGYFDLTGEMDRAAGTFNGTGTFLSDRTPAPLVLTFHGSKDKALTSIDYSLQSGPMIIADTVLLSPVVLDGKATIKQSSATLIINGSIAEIVDRRGETVLKEISLHMPLRFPLPENETGPPGTLTIGAVIHRGISAGALHVSMTPSRQQILFTSTFTPPAAPDLRLLCTGSLRTAKDLSIACEIPQTTIDSATLPLFPGLPKELSFSGKISVAGDFHAGGSKAEGKLTATLQEATLQYKQNILSDINVTVDFPRLPIVRSSPGQLCTIGTLEFGKIHLFDARIHFRIDDTATLFLEKSRFNWCGGKVESGSARITRSMQELDTTLYCDRIGFTELLQQFGIDNTEGQGSLNGRLPLRITSQGIMFDDGFLFSTPGKSGILRFNNTELLLQGLPDIDRAAYLDYVMKALENFTYNWTKLSFNSHGKDLLILMQLDGKPSAPLPFGYKDGRIVSTPTGPGLQHPITLDLNFRLPLHDLLQFGKEIQSKMENK